MTMTSTFKKLFTAILAIVMVAALLLSCVACKPADTGNNDTNINTNKYEGMTDVEYAQALLQDNLAGAVDALAAGFGAYADAIAMGTSSSEMGATAELDVMLGDFAIGLVEQALFGMADSGFDMSFLTNVGLDLEMDATADMAQFALALALSDTEIVELLLLGNEETVYVGAPDLTEKFLEVDLATMGVAVNTATPAWVDGLATAIPSEEKTSEILNRYLALVVKEIETVERTTETLELDGMKQDATKLAIKIYEQDALDAAKAVLNAAKTDADLKMIVENFGKFYNDMMAELYADPSMNMVWEDVDAYAEFIKFIDEGLTTLPAEAEDTENPIGLTLYVDAEHNFIGCDLTIPGQDNVICATRMITEGNNFKYLCEMGDVGGDMKITGSGTTSNGAITGTYAVISDGTTFVTVELKDFAADTDTVNGTITLKPTEDAIQTLFNGPIPVLNTTDVALQIKLNGTKDSCEIELKLLGDNAMLIGLALKAASKAPVAPQTPTNTVPLTDQQSVVDLLAEMDFTSVFTNLRTAGVPEMLITALESLVPAV